jgi:Uma2 family endonuclease
LAIEVVWTSGGLRKLDIYLKLGVKEVWFWRRGQITVHVLGDDGYAERASSVALPGIDLEQLVSYLDRPSASQAIKEYISARRIRE